MYASVCAPRTLACELSTPWYRTMCVEGLAEEGLGEAALELVERAGADVDLVRWEDASPRLRARIAADGVEVPRVAG